jgi:hypothetical protein
MKYGIAWLIFLVIVAQSGVAGAQTPRAWNETDLVLTPPTSCTDSTPITNCPITGFRIERATAEAGPWTTIATLPPNVTTHRATGLPAGTNWFRFIVLAATPSVPSNAVSSENKQPAPNPGTLRVVNATAWEVRPNSTGTLVVSRIGVVPLTSVCGSEQRTVGSETYTRIDPKLVDLVNWPNTLPPVDVFAKCG